MLMSNLIIATPAAPAPLVTTRILSIDFLTTLRALIIPAMTTMAVPCWSSWKTGMFISFFKRSSISKHAGALMSSKLIPPKVGSKSLTVSINFSISSVSKQIGKASTPANVLKSTDFPSITGIAASAPMFPRPRTAVPLETMATRFPLFVYA